MVDFKQYHFHYLISASFLSGHNEDKVLKLHSWRKKHYLSFSSTFSLNLLSQVASLSLPNFKHNPDDPEKKGKIDFFVSPNSFDKVTSAAPCAPWIMKTASTTRADSDNGSDGDDDNCHFKLQTTDVKVSVLSMTLSIVRWSRHLHISFLLGVPGD